MLVDDDVEVGVGVLAGVGVAVNVRVAVGVSVLVGESVGVDGSLLAGGEIDDDTLVGDDASPAAQEQPVANTTRGVRNAMRTIYGRRFIASPRLIQRVDRHDVERMRRAASQPDAHSPRNLARTQEAQAPRLRSKPSSLFSMSYRHS